MRAAAADLDTTVHLAGLAELFVTLADTLVDDFDVVDLMDRLTGAAVAMFDVAAAGLLLRDQRGGLHVIASSSHQAGVLEVFQVQSEQGPCLDCIASGRLVTVSDLATEGQRWPRFADAAARGGFASVHAVPMRLREQVIGGLNLFGRAGRVLSEGDRRIAQAMADMATIGILQQRSRHRPALLTEQLQVALNTRVVIEQAKGMLAQHAHVGMDQAFVLLRSYVRAHDLKLGAVSQALVEGRLPTGHVAGDTGPAGTAGPG